MKYHEEKVIHNFIIKLSIFKSLHLILDLKIRLLMFHLSIRLQKLRDCAK